MLNHRNSVRALNYVSGVLVIMYDMYDLPVFIQRSYVSLKHDGK